MIGDAETRYAFPSFENQCYRVEPPEPVVLTHQSAVCLSSEYKSCPVYKGEKGGELPVGLRGEDIFETRQWGRKLWGVIVACLLVGFIIIIWINQVDLISTIRVGLEKPSHDTTTTVSTASQDVTMTNVDHLIISPTVSPLTENVVGATTQAAVLPTNTTIPSLTSTLIPPPTPSPTVPPTPDLSAALTVPFGPNDEYVLHRVLLGESTPILIDCYLTSAEVIWAANVIEGSIRLDQVLVILPGRTDPTDIELFYVIFVENATQVEDLALQVGIPLADLLYFNDLGAGEQIPAGSWLIYPAQSD